MFSPPTKAFSFLPQPTQAWLAILGLALFLSLCLLLGAGKILILAFPTGSFAVGLFLYLRYPILYFGFTWWIWFLGPWIRRMIDYQSGYLTPGPWVLVPLLVTSITVITWVRHFPKSFKQNSLPFVLCFGSIVYGFLIALIQREIAIDTLVVALLGWLSPILFSFHLYVNWRDYPRYRQALQRIFLWGVLVMGSYGIIQFLLAPDWDRFWLIHSPIDSAGEPAPLQIRVWSTLNAPGPFGVVMMAGLLLLFINQGALRLPASAVGYLSFLLSMSRSAWGTWLVGLLTLNTSLKAKHQVRLVITVMVMVLCVLPLATLEPFSAVISERTETFSDLENDNSANARKATYQELLGTALTSLLGQGIGGPAHDSAILTMLLELGWFGTIFYIGGLLLVLLSLFQSSESRFDPFAGVARAVALAVFTRIPFAVPFVEAQGMILWGFLGLGMIAKKYYQYHQITALGQPNLQNHLENQLGY